MDLEVWQKCRELRKKIWTFCKTLPSIEKLRLSDQMIRASRSATANIAEGYGRYNYQENIQYCRLSRGSLQETRDHLSTALDCDYISNKEYQTLDSLTITCLKLINGYINYLIRQKKTI
ncbi:MAG: four helix bundle protein [Bacteroidales bacterium]|nr:four helix bundle protein [Bacteroidales bacterium]